jgi:hypothetical protein
MILCLTLSLAGRNGSGLFRHSVTAPQKADGIACLLERIVMSFSCDQFFGSFFSSVDQCDLLVVDQGIS